MSESFQSFLYCKVPLTSCFTLLNVTDSSVEASNNRSLGVGKKNEKESSVLFQFGLVLVFTTTLRKLRTTWNMYL